MNEVERDLGRSVLVPHVSIIRDMRAKEWSIPKIRLHLSEAFQINVTAQAIGFFCRRNEIKKGEVEKMDYSTYPPLPPCDTPAEKATEPSRLLFRHEELTELKESQPQKTLLELMEEDINKSEEKIAEELKKNPFDSDPF